MSIYRLESIPQTWNHEIDAAFFTITARLFSAEFTYGASVLLAAADNDGTTVDCAGTTPMDADVTAAVAADLVPVPVHPTR